MKKKQSATKPKAGIAKEVDDFVAGMERAGKLSKTGTGRFDELKKALASRLSTDWEQIYIVACKRPNNLNIRLSQGAAQHKHHELGIGVITAVPEIGQEQAKPDLWVERGLKAGRTYIAEGNAKYDAVGVVVKKNGVWTVGGVIESQSCGIAANLSADFPNLVIEKVKVGGGATPPTPPPGPQPPPVGTLESMVEAFHSDLTAAGLFFRRETVHRFCASLLSRPFLILTGLPGSGKTKLAQAFATWLSADAKGQAPYFKIIPVGADWTSSEQVLGYPDALNPNRYATQPSLDLILSSTTSGRDNRPHILILDEMNMSHVERYFGEFLSAMETGAEVELYAGAERQGVPSTIVLPPNLYVVGTVNVDETTYLFSPKVLDRANVIEFRADKEQLFGLLDKFAPIDLASMRGMGAHFGESFVETSGKAPALDGGDKDALIQAFQRVFAVMEVFGREFGFRTLNEAGRFVFHSRQLTVGTWDVDVAIDAQIYQRVLPKLHGSRAQLQMLLWGLASLCLEELSEKEFEKQVLRPLERREASNPFDGAPPDFEHAKYPLSCAKIYRMCERLRDGFTSFMEA